MVLLYLVIVIYAITIVKFDFVHSSQHRFSQSSNITDTIIRVRITEKTFSLPHFGQYEVNRWSLLIFSWIEYDYKDIKNTIPFNQYYQHMEARYESFGQSSFFPSYVLTGHIPEYKSGDNRIIVTGGSSNHFASVPANLLSVLNASVTINLVFIDFGLNQDELVHLRSTFEYLHKVQLAVNCSSFIAYRKFDFHNAPSWMNIHSNDEHGGYAWKIISLLDIVDEWKALTGWMDAGNIVYDGLHREFAYAMEEGIYTPTRANPGDIFSRWTHPLMIQYFRNHSLIAQVDRNKSNCAAGHIFIDYKNKTVYDRILTPWKQCVYTRKCVRPYESNRSNHRWEQAALTTLLQNVNLTYANNVKYEHFPHIRMESQPKRWLLDYEKKLKKEICEKNAISVE